MFRIHDYIFYPRYGVGVVSDIVVVDENPSVSYQAYQVVILSTQQSIRLPIDQSENMGIRNISTPDQIEECLALLESPDVPALLTDEDNWKNRKKELDQFFLQGSIQDHTLLVKFLCYRNIQKTLGAGERKIFDSSLEFLVDEIAYGLKTDSVIAEDILTRRIQDFLVQFS